MSATAVQFPSKEAIISYLEQHPLTNDPYLTEKKIIEAVATFFANQRKVPMGIKIGVMLTMHDLGTTRDLLGSVVVAIGRNLSQALLDCANGKPIQKDNADEKPENVEIKAKL